MSSIIFDLLSTRSLLVYHPLACNDQICVDIDNRLISNPIASILNLLRCFFIFCRSMKILSEQITKHYNVELLGQHLNRLSTCFIDQQLIECCRLNESPHLLTNQLI